MSPNRINWYKFFDTNIIKKILINNWDKLPEKMYGKEPGKIPIINFVDDWGQSIYISFYFKGSPFNGAPIDSSTITISKSQYVETNREIKFKQLELN